MSGEEPATLTTRQPEKWVMIDTEERSVWVPRRGPDGSFTWGRASEPEAQLAAEVAHQATRRSPGTPG